MTLALADYLELTPREAQAQWQSIVQRSASSPGGRQEDFRPVETLLSYGLFFVMNPHRYGGRNMNAAPAPFHRVCAAIRRSGRSVLEKMLNLDGTRSHRAKNEWELFVHLEGDLRQYSYLYRICLASARAVGIPPESLPDFLGLEQSGELHLLGQDDLPAPALGPSLEPEVAVESHRLGASEQETERLLLAKARMGQHGFARDVLSRCEGACVFCGMAPRSLPRESLMVASHVKPWVTSDSRERLDLHNGVAACPTHDAAFDRGLLTVAADGAVIRGERLLVSMARDPGMAEHFGDSAIVRAIAPRFLPKQVYLDYHRSEVFR